MTEGKKHASTERPIGFVKGDKGFAYVYRGEDADAKRMELSVKGLKRGSDDFVTGK
jgi:hypothetical protein